MIDLTYPAEELSSVMDYDRGLHRYSRAEINEAARTLTDAASSLDVKVHAAVAINEWRILHQEPISRFWDLLAARVWAVEFKSGLAMRLKRMTAMLGKLQRMKSLGREIELWEMQDIGGLRTVVGSPGEAMQLADSLLTASPRFDLVKDLRRDYIVRPKQSGYRGIHLVYAYRANSGDDRILEGLRIEVQIRTQFQHAWATANEVVGTFRGEALKSSDGHPDWLRFFTLAGTAIAIREGTPCGPNVPLERIAFDAEFAALRGKLNVFHKMSAYNVTMQAKDSDLPKNTRFFVLTLDLRRKQLDVKGFVHSEFAQAVDKAFEIEQQHMNDPNFDTVLVSVDGLANLESAYPNYFADTKAFLDIVYEGAMPEDVPVDPAGR